METDHGDLYDLSGLDEYTYEPLKANEIRLLRLFAAPSPELPIRCRLDTVNLDDIRTFEEIKKDPPSHVSDPPNWYEALSYVWGPAFPVDLITIVDGVPKKFVVRENLFNALKRIRYEHNTASLWIDQICIYQNDES